MKTPNFFIIGAAKVGTTSLAALLASHPEAAMAQTKEPHFFSFDGRYERGWSAYLTLFNHCQDETAVGDASTSYSRIRYHPATIARIKRHVPNAKILYMVRNPLNRMVSAYVEHAATPSGEYFMSVNEAVRLQPMILDSSCYWEVFSAYAEAFGEANVKVVWFEEYIKRMIAVFRDVCRFLGIQDSIVPAMDPKSVNSRASAMERVSRLRGSGATLDVSWTEETKRWVLDQICEDNGRFLAHFGRRVSYWWNES